MKTPWRSGYAYDADGNAIGIVNARTATWDENGWVEGQPDPAKQLAAAREAAAMKRGPFLLAMRDLGVITTATAKEAAEKWPSAFDPFIAGLTDDEQIMAKTIWRDGRDVRRMNTILLQIQAFVNAEPSLPDVSDAQLDTVFGVSA